MSTPAERAQEAVEVLERRVARFDVRIAELHSKIAGIEMEKDDAQARLEYARKSPDLPVHDPDLVEVFLSDGKEEPQ